MNNGDLGVLYSAAFCLNEFGEKAKSFRKQAIIPNIEHEFTFGESISLDEGARLIKLMHEHCPEALICGMEEELNAFGTLDDTDLIKSIYNEAGYTSTIFFEKDYQGKDEVRYRIFKQ